MLSADCQQSLNVSKFYAPTLRDLVGFLKKQGMLTL